MAVTDYEKYIRTDEHSELLESGRKTRFFPALWEVRDEVFGDWTAAQASKGNETGYHG